jgi:hypothetical protein
MKEANLKYINSQKKRSQLDNKTATSQQLQLTPFSDPPKSATCN